MASYRNTALAMGVAAALTALVIAAVLFVTPSLSEAQGEPRTIDPGPGTHYIEPGLWGLMYKHAAKEDGLPPRVEVAIGVHSDVKVAKSLSDQITGDGGSHVSENIWRVPTGSLAAVVQRPDVRSIRYAPGVTGAVTTPGILSRVGGDLDEVISARSNGVPASQAAKAVLIASKGKVGVVVEAKTAAAKTAAATWLSNRNIYMPAPRGDAGLTLAAMMPVDQISPFLKANTGVSATAFSYKGQGLEVDRARWSESARDFENDLITFFTTGVVPGESANGGVSGQEAVAPPTPNPWDSGLSDRLTAHGARAWQLKDTGYTGKDVKVGIIDWGFHDLDATPGLTDMTKKPTGNAYCQPEKHSIWPKGGFIDLISDECEPNLVVTQINHGVNIAELVKDIAPDADLFYAQANSPRQVYRAAKWLDETKNVDVIVHAGGWPYDGPGDGWSPFGMSYHDEDKKDWFTDEHSSYRYYPSPLTTVDQFVDSDGPVWVNAAGNMETITLWTDDPERVGSGVYANHIKMNSSVVGTDRAANLRRACQTIPVNRNGIYTYNLRWADDWNNPKVDLDFLVFPQSVDPLRDDDDVFISSYDHGDNTVEQFADTIPVRRGTKINLLGEDQQMCLAIRVNSSNLPEWIQFQIITQNYDSAATWNQSLGDQKGRSIVNPSDSINQGLLAVGARDIRASAVQLMDYSSRGPVYAHRANQKTTDPSRIKPDATAASGAATYTKYRTECGGTGTAAVCGDDLYFGGTSAATGHTGGLAALVVQLYKEIGGTYSPQDIADYLRDSGEQIARGVVSDNNDWGKGFIQLPCRPEVITFPYAGTGDAWSATDCESTRQVGRYADYYTFRLSANTTIEVTLNASSSALDPYLYLLEGAYTGKTASLASNNDRATTSDKDSRIEKTLAPGIYTVVATTTGTGSATGSYQLNIKKKPAQVTPIVSLSPSTITLTDDGEWQEFSLSTNVPVTAVVNPTGQTRRVEIVNRDISSNYCPPEQNDDFSYTTNGTLYLAGCSAGSGVLEIRRTSDWHLIRSYPITIKTPVVAPTWDATLSPSPTAVGFTSDGTWHGFSVASGGAVEVVVNPTGAKRLEISTSSGRNLCPGETGDDVARTSGQAVYLAGCLTGTGTIELRREADNSLVRTYQVTISDPSPTWDATLSPNPASRKFVNDGSWHSFTLASGGEVEVVVNPSGAARLEISTSSGSNLCPPELGDDKTIDNGDTIYIAGCVSGSGTIELRRTADDSLVRTYAVTIGTSTPTVCNPLRSFDAARRSGSSVYVSWSNPVSGGLASTGRQVEIKKWVKNAWQSERKINEPSSRNYSWHLGLDSDSYYTYRGRNLCGSTSSRWSSWETVIPWVSDSSGASGAEGPPAPTPTPTWDGATGSSSSEEDDEQPPTPRD